MESKTEKKGRRILLVVALLSLFGMIWRVLGDGANDHMHLFLTIVLAGCVFFLGLDDIRAFLKGKKESNSNKP